MNQRCPIVKYFEWPFEARNRWEVARSARRILNLDRQPVRWGSEMARNVIAAYGAWLGWSRAQGNAQALAPGPQQVEAFATYLQAHFADATVEHRIRHLERAVALLEPRAERRHFNTVLANLKANGVRKDKRKRLQDAASLVDFGVEVMQEAVDAAALRSEIALARQFRNGLQIALLALRPLRIKNFRALRLGQHLLKRGSEWWISIDGTEVKNRQPIDVPFPPMIVKYLEAYLAKYRSALAGGELCDGSLWISGRKQPQSSKSIAFNIGRHTKARFGQPLSPHLFRDSAATSIAIHDPENVGIIAAILGHTNLATAQRHYNQAKCIDAGRRQAATISAMRSKLERMGSRNDGRNQT